MSVRSTSPDVFLGLRRRFLATLRTGAVTHGSEEFRGPGRSESRRAGRSCAGGFVVATGRRGQGAGHEGRFAGVVLGGVGARQCPAVRHAMTGSIRRAASQPMPELLDQRTSARERVTDRARRSCSPTVQSKDQQSAPLRKAASFAGVVESRIARLAFARAYPDWSPYSVPPGRGRRPSLPKRDGSVVQLAQVDPERGGEGEHRARPPSRTRSF